jgi:hypothetical protein
VCGNHKNYCHYQRIDAEAIVVVLAAAAAVTTAGFTDVCFPRRRLDCLPHWSILRQLQSFVGSCALLLLSSLSPNPAKNEEDTLEEISKVEEQSRGVVSSLHRGH